METKILNIDVSKNQRLLFLSDIHGNLDAFVSILDKAKFKKKDALFLLGDIIEKGDNSIGVIDYIFKLKEEGYNIYTLMGNCEELLSYMMPPVNKDSLLNYILNKKSILNEFTKKLRIRITKESNLNTVCWYCHKEFKKYYDYILDLPHIININNTITLVHGGIDDDIINNPHTLMKNDNFYFKTNRLNKLTIVGHFPTVNYHDDYANLNPIIDLNKNLICIDGGNNVVPFGQLNLLIIDNINSMNISYITYDNFPEIKVLNNICGNNLKLFNMPYLDNKVEIIDELNDYYICKHISSGTIVPILKLYVFHNDENDLYYAYDAFNYMPNIKSKTKIKLVKKADPYSIVKINGVMGLIETKNLKRK